MKKEFKDLSVDEKKEFMFLNTFVNELPYIFAIIPFLVLCVVYDDVLIKKVLSLIVILVFMVCWFIDRRRFKKIYGLD